jgi:hypothetical protein
MKKKEKYLSIEISDKSLIKGIRNSLIEEIDEYNYKVKIFFKLISEKKHSH